MILDTSAIVAVLLEEPEAERIFNALTQADAPGVGAPTLTETGVVLGNALGFHQRLLLRFLQEFRIAIIPFGEHHWWIAVQAYERFGRGRHPAKLNFGDCLTYATTKLARQPLLCKGSDFIKTDLDLVSY